MNANDPTAFGHFVYSLIIILVMSACGRHDFVRVEEPTISSLVGTVWGQPDRWGRIWIWEKSVSYTEDGCNTLRHDPEDEFIFRANGSIKSVDVLNTTEMNCDTPRDIIFMTGRPGSSWISYQLQQNELVVTTKSGELLHFIRCGQLEGACKSVLK